MFFIRQAQPDDAPRLLKLAKLVHSNNLPPDADAIRERVARSRESFRKRVKDKSERLFVFVLEDSESNSVVGSSIISPLVGTPSKPHLYLQTRKREFFSTELQTGAVHMTVQLKTDTTGHSEIGGLVLSLAYRGHKSRLGSLLSLSRFNFIGRHRTWFCDRIVAEMMAPLTADSRNTLWEYLGRRFINLDYTEADTFCRHSKEFILSLFPPEEIYVSLLPPPARNVIGKVGPDTEPALAMLKRLGFKESGHVDPFDGGPYLEAKTDEIPLVRDTKGMKLAGADGRAALTHSAIVSYTGENGYRAVRVECALKGGEIAIPADAIAILEAATGAEVGVTVLHALSAETESASGATDAAEEKVTA
jgi:arginine N-succinyltransferase